LFSISNYYRNFNAITIAFSFFSCICDYGFYRNFDVFCTFAFSYFILVLLVSNVGIFRTLFYFAFLFSYFVILSYVWRNFYFRLSLLFIILLFIVSFYFAAYYSPQFWRNDFRWFGIFIAILTHFLLSLFLIFYFVFLSHVRRNVLFSFYFAYYYRFISYAYYLFAVLTQLFSLFLLYLRLFIFCFLHYSSSSFFFFLLRLFSLPYLFDFTHYTHIYISTLHTYLHINVNIHSIS